ncbi:MAG: OB-fold nucleic acid binding domain-containing protein [Chloroflexi bacterium]|nr:OB-fold nucleic acid binding domain-containing protein [Chloroflexota bacterium]
MDNRLTRGWVSLFVVLGSLGLWSTPAVAAPANESAITPISQISAGDSGKVLTVQATVTGTEQFSRGFRYHLDDTTAQMVLLVNEGDYDTIAGRDQLNVGSVVQVTGRIRTSNGTLQIIPSRGRYVQVVTPATNGWRKYSLGAMNGNDHNATVWVEGVIAGVGPYVNTKASPYQYGTMLVLNDGTGAQKIMIRDVVARHVTQREKLAVGQRVSVVGRVFATSKVGIEIRAVVPSDVVVLP